MRLETHYGKAEVSTYRTKANPLTGTPVIPESAYHGRPHDLLAAEIEVRVMGRNVGKADRIQIEGALEIVDRRGVVSQAGCGAGEVIHDVGLVGFGLQSPAPQRECLAVLPA